MYSPLCIRFQPHSTTNLYTLAFFNTNFDWISVRAFEAIHQSPFKLVQWEQCSVCTVQSHRQVHIRNLNVTSSAATISNNWKQSSRLRAVRTNNSIQSKPRAHSWKALIYFVGFSLRGAHWTRARMSRCESMWADHKLPIYNMFDKLYLIMDYKSVILIDCQ